MGIDFIRKAAKSFKKGLDKSRIELATPDLFTVQPDCEPRSYAATIRADIAIDIGEDLSVGFQHDDIVARRGMVVVAVFRNPPRELIDALNESYGEACGTVQQVHIAADVAEISVC